MTAEHGPFPPFGGSCSDLSSRLGLPTRSPFGLPPQPSPFVAHFYPMVNSARPTIQPPILNPDPALTSSTPGSFLASVAARRTDLLYSEFYKNLLKTAVKAQPFISPDDSVGIENKNSTKFSETSPSRKGENIQQDAGRIASLDNYANPAAQLRSFYEGLYGRLTPNDYLLRLRADQNNGQFCIPNFRGTKNVTSPSSPNWSATSTSPPEAVSAFSRVSSLKPPQTSFNRFHLHQTGAFPALSSYAMKTRANQQRDFKRQSNDNSNSSSQNNPSPNADSQNILKTPSNITSPPNGIHSPTSSVSNNVIASDSSDGRPSSAYSSSERLKRKRRSTGCGDTCPICGVTVRESEMQQHLKQEIGKLDKIGYEVYRNNLKKHAKATRRISGPTSSHLSMQSDSSIAATTSKKHDEANDNDTTSKENRFRTFQKVRGNRLDRFNSRVGQCRVPGWRNGAMFSGKPMAPWIDYNNNSIAVQSNRAPIQARFEGVRCPVCEISLGHMSSHEQISDHVMHCAGTRDDKDVPGESGTVVDVEDDDGAFEEYEWCGETRVRATTLVHRDLLASTPGFHVMRNAENEDSDQDLNVETDETCEYGVVQYSDKDLVPPSTDDENDRTPSYDHAEKDTGCLDTSPEDKTMAFSHPSTVVDNMKRINMECHSPSVVVQALRLKIQELESSSQDNRCLICMESYKNPLVSIQCWHVHCEKCWLKALGVKKLCPQCNMITPASHLRRIFL
ncbi:uncharacterized protein LOC120336878 isoform X1 [Styela clava]